MINNLNLLVEQMKIGVILTDRQLRIEYANKFASTLLTDSEIAIDGSNLSDFQVLSSNHVIFELSDCIQAQIASGKNNFHKTLIIKTEKTERIVYFTGQMVNGVSDALLLFTVADISGEMECIAESQSIFEDKHNYLVNKIIGHHETIRQIFRKIIQVADTGVNVMILGESGTGKELVAEAIHELSPRVRKPLVKVNCSALSESLLESELFGHVKGAFTGAYRDKAGKFELANGGTIFLDEIGEISLGLQVKLLRVIQEKTIERVGDSKSIKVDMRIVAATNKNLKELIRKGLFREDLYYRLNVFSIEVPALRNRANDIPDLVKYFIEKFNKNHSRSIKGINRQALRILMNYSWPGNIRELQNMVEYAFVIAIGNIISKEDLPADIMIVANMEKALNDQHLLAPLDQKELLNPISRNTSGRLKITKDQLEAMLAKNQWNQSQTAKVLGISRVSLWKKMKTFELEIPD
ncbi:MAG TPA: hypothetical protein DCM62_05445 [Bacteroidales bacterium]|nr:hypothetical protein [Bacteroidales bacterium]